MTWDNISAIIKLFFVLLLLDTDSSFRLKGKYAKRHFLPGLGKTELVSKMSQG